MNVYINDYGLTTTKRNHTRAAFDSRQPINVKKADFEELSRIREFRRLDRMSLLTISNVIQVLGNEKVDSEQAYSWGTIMNSSYGPVDTNISLIDQYLSKGSAGVSPITFSHTVNNAALGHLCIKGGFGGPSTFLLSSNYVAAASRILKANKAKQIFACGIEPFSDQVWKSFEDIGIELTEMAATLILSSERTESSMGYLVSYYEENLGGHPYLERFEINKIRLLQIMKKSIEKANLNIKDIKCVFLACYPDDTLSTEKEAIADLFEGSSNSYDLYDVKSETGETLGASLGVSFSYATQMIYNNRIEDQQTYYLVNHYDISGNFCSFVLSST